MWETIFAVIGVMCIAASLAVVFFAVLLNRRSPRELEDYGTPATWEYHPGVIPIERRRAAR